MTLEVILAVTMNEISENHGMSGEGLTTNGNNAPIVADVLVLLPLARTYSYLIPEPLKDHVKRGRQVLCSVRNRAVHGVVMDIRAKRPDDPPLEPILEVVVARPPWPDDLLNLVKWLSRYYVAPIGLVARTAMPSLFAKKTPRPTVYVRFVRHPEIPPRSDRTRALLTALEQAKRMEISAARKLVPHGSEMLKRLLRTGCVVIEEDFTSNEHDVLPPTIVDRPMLTSAQEKAFAAISDSIGKGYKAFLLHGVTGSGKTEIYLRAIENVLEKGGGAIVLVPEIALTYELRHRFEERLGAVAAVLHSAMPETKRVAIWNAVLEGRIRVVVGPRSVVFAPVRNLALIVVDEEHEATYKQEEGLRYNARDAAMVRGREARCPVILGSATPSLETFENTHQGKVVYLSLPERVMARPMPEVRFIDLRYEQPAGPGALMSKTLANALTEVLSRGETAILFLNRRGFGRVVLCRVCGAVVSCPNCSITLTHHAKPARLICHYCDHQVPVPDRCPSCNSSEIEILGFGTERIEDEVTSIIPGARCARLDADTAACGGIDRILEAFRRGETNVLIGTQIIAKGYDFPYVTLVGVLLAEQSLAFPDFRAAERTFQLLTQVAGRAGRGDAPGLVYIQTYDPSQYALRFAASHDFLGFAVWENRLRRERGYPPHTHLAAIEVSSPDYIEAMKLAEEVRDYLGNFLKLEGAAGDEVTLLGPAVAPIERLRGRTRMQVLMKGRRRAIMNAALWRLRRLLGDSRGKARIRIDVDPVNLL